MPSGCQTAQPEAYSPIRSIFSVVLTHIILFRLFDARRDISFLLDAGASSGRAFPGGDFAREFSYLAQQAGLLQGADTSGPRRHVASKLNRAIGSVVKTRLCLRIYFSQERLRASSADLPMIDSPWAVMRVELLTKLVPQLADAFDCDGDHVDRSLDAADAERGAAADQVTGR